jgi:hypothetical protein
LITRSKARPARPAKPAPSGLTPTAQAGQARKLKREACRLFLGAVGDQEFGRAFQQQREYHAARGAAGAQQKDATACWIAAEVVLQVAHQAGAIGVVADDGSGIEAQRIDRAGGLGARAALGGEAEGILLEGHRDIDAAPAGRPGSR